LAAGRGVGQDAGGGARLPQPRRGAAARGRAHRAPGRRHTDRVRGEADLFTGIVEEIGTVERVRRGAASAELRILARTVLEDIHLGDSIAVNGVCLTVTDFDGAGFSADVMHETLNRSSLAQVRAGARVNLERAMAANGRFGGHIVA